VGNHHSPVTPHTVIYAHIFSFSFFGQFAYTYISYLPAWKSGSYVGLNHYKGGTWNRILMGEKIRKKKPKDHKPKGEIKGGKGICPLKSF